MEMCTALCETALEACLMFGHAKRVISQCCHINEYEVPTSIIVIHAFLKLISHRTLNNPDILPHLYIIVLIFYANAY